VELAPPQSRTFRLPKSTYLAVLFLIFCVLPLAFTADGSYGPQPVYGPRMLFLLIPAGATVFIARTATFVDSRGIRVRAAFGARRIPWDELRGLNVAERAVYAVLVDGEVRLPCVRIADLATITRLSNGRMPQVAEARPKYAPSRRSRRR
jgi:hypothetical protein